MIFLSTHTTLCLLSGHLVSTEICGPTHSFLSMLSLLDFLGVVAVWWVIHTVANDQTSSSQRHPLRSALNLQVHCSLETSTIVPSFHMPSALLNLLIQGPGSRTFYFEKFLEELLKLWKLCHQPTSIIIFVFLPYLQLFVSGFSTLHFYLVAEVVYRKTMYLKVSRIWNSSLTGEWFQGSHHGFWAWVIPDKCSNRKDTLWLPAFILHKPQSALRSPTYELINICRWLKLAISSAFVA